MDRPTLIMGNWKMNLGGAAAVDLARALVQAAPRVDPGEVVLIPSPVHVAAVGSALEGSELRLGAQDCVAEGPGAVTGGTSAVQLAELGVRWVLVGHSERRALFGEDDALLARKFAAVLAAGMRPVLCVGETLEEREAGRTTDRVRTQLDAVLSGGVDGAFALAYEPVWAIGTGRNARLEDVVEVHALARERVAAAAGEDVAARTPILYGGSVNDENAGEYLGHPEVDGALVGGASLDRDRFLAICSAAANGAI